MLFHRLLSDDQDGFDLAPMESADYDFGASANGCLMLAQETLDNTLDLKPVTLVESWGQSRSDPIEALVVGRRSYLDEIQNVIVVRTTKEMLLTDDEDFVAWIAVGHTAVEPMVLIRTQVDFPIKRLTAFLRPYMQVCMTNRLFPHNH